MIKINLLPFRAARKKENVRQQISIFLLTIVLCVLGMICWGFLLSKQVGTLNKNIDRLTVELKKYEAKAAEVDRLTNELRMLTQKVDVIKQLEINRKSPLKLMKVLTEVVVPERMWFTNFHYKDKDFSVQGIAVDNKTVADFMNRLEASSIFKDINLITLNRVVKNNLKLKSFNISGSREQPKKPGKSKAKK